MAKFEIIHSCGHSQIHNISGPIKNRDSKAKWLAEQECSECWKVEQAAEREIAHAEAGAAADRFEAGADDLPTLEGTARQVAWARSIRAVALGAIGTELEKIGGQLAQMTGTDSEAEGNRQAGIIRQVAAEWKAEASAKWWIEHRHENADPKTVAACWIGEFYRAAQNRF